MQLSVQSILLPAALEGGPNERQPWGYRVEVKDYRRYVAGEQPVFHGSFVPSGRVGSAARS